MTREKARVLVTAATQTRAEAIAGQLVLPRPIDAAPESSLPRSLSPYKLLVAELGRARLPRTLSRIRKDAHVVLLVPSLDVAATATLMKHPQVAHVINSSAHSALLQVTVDKLETGSIFGLDHYLPDSASVQYRTVRSFEERCRAIEELDDFAKAERVRGGQRRSLCTVVEELLMNALYQAPFDETGQQVFAEIEPEERTRLASPRPVSLRYARVGGAFVVSVRDRFGSLRRDDLARALWRCVSEEQQIEQKRLGAGLGLYLIVTRARALIVNILPRQIAELICVIGEPRDHQLQIVSVTTQAAVTTG